MKTHTILRFSAALLLSLSAASAASVTYYTTEHYYRRADSPFYAGIQAGTIYLEDFENLPFGSPHVSTPYISASTGHVKTSAGATVDEDDGLDGKWVSGYAWISGFGGDAGIGMSFEFERDPRGRLPTYVGLALLGFTRYSEEVIDCQMLIYDADGTEVTNGEFLSRLPVYPNTNITSSIGDRFIGAYVEGGISRIELGARYIDHLQYGYAIPEPSAFLLTGLSLTFLLRRPCRSAGKSLS